MTKCIHREPSTTIQCDTYVVLNVDAVVSDDDGDVLFAFCTNDARVSLSCVACVFRSFLCWLMSYYNKAYATSTHSHRYAKYIECIRVGINRGTRHAHSNLCVTSLISFVYKWCKRACGERNVAKFTQIESESESPPDDSLENVA